MLHATMCFPVNFISSTFTISLCLESFRYEMTDKPPIFEKSVIISFFFT